MRLETAANDKGAIRVNLAALHTAQYEQASLSLKTLSRFKNAKVSYGPLPARKRL
jgi:hypothetical protein